jgi:hypothetical protein
MSANNKIERVELGNRRARIESSFRHAWIDIIPALENDALRDVRDMHLPSGTELMAVSQNLGKDGRRVSTEVIICAVRESAVQAAALATTKAVTAYF